MKRKLRLFGWMLALLSTTACTSLQAVSPHRISESYTTKKIESENLSLEQHLKTSPNLKFVAIPSNEQPARKNYGLSTTDYQIEYKNTPIYLTRLKVHSRSDGTVRAINGTYFDGFDLDVSPVLDETVSRQLIEKLASTQKLLEPEIFGGDLLLYVKERSKNRFTPHLAYKFELTSKNRASDVKIFLDAKTGQILDKISMRAELTGQGQTRYSGLQSFPTELVGSQYALQDNSGSRGNGIETIRSGGNDFLDNDNNWTTAEHQNAARDNAALDAHWGASKIYDYFSDQYGRNGFDNLGTRLKISIEQPPSFNTAAYWYFGSNLYPPSMSLGLGDGVNFDPLTSINTVAHEFGHGLIYSEGVSYIYDSDKILQEGFSDIFGVMVSHHVTPNVDIWRAGSVNSLTGVPIRALDTPKAFGGPDTFYGTNYGSDPHYGGNVIGHWFYLLSEGGQGTNDNGHNYDVKGIGVEDAGKIAYRTIATYATSLASVEHISVLAAEDIFGRCSRQVRSVREAWPAVGLADPLFYPTTSLPLSGTLSGSSNQTFSDYNIESSSNITATGAVKFEALNEIQLKPGYKTSQNQSFHGYICPAY